MNPFDIVVCAVAIVAIVKGFSAGLLRNLATILGYLIAAPIAVAVTPGLATLVLGQHLPASGQAAASQTWLLLCIVFIAAGVIISALLRVAVGEFVGPDIGLFDRVGGAALGAVRIALVAVLIVAVFDRVIPAGREPQFLATSRLRPYLSGAGQKGLQSLPPDMEAYIDRLRRQRGI